MNYIKINNKTKTQIENIIKKMVKEGLTSIYLRENNGIYQLYGRSDRIFDNELLYIIDPKTIGIDKNKKGIYGIEDGVTITISNLVREVTGMKFEFIWDKNLTLDKMIIENPYNSFFD